MKAEWFLTLLLRVNAVVLMMAFPTLLLPVDWMEATHEWLGLGEFPRATITDYMARSLSALYGFHGVFVWIIASDVRRYQTLVIFLGWMAVVYGVMLLAVDLHAGLPLYWTVGEGPLIFVLGIVVLYLVTRSRVPDSR